MPAWEIVGLIVLGITLFILAIRFGLGLVGLFFDILFAIFGSSKSSGSSGGGGFGGGDSGGGGSSDDW